MPLNSGLCEESAVALYIIKKRKKRTKEKKKIKNEEAHDYVDSPYLFTA